MFDSIIKNHAAFICSVADLLRGDYKQSEYGKVIMPLTVLRRQDCVLEPKKANVLERHSKLEGSIDNIDPVLCALAGPRAQDRRTRRAHRLCDTPHVHFVVGLNSGEGSVHTSKTDLSARVVRLSPSEC